jgi:hypothetical protein
MTQAAPALPRPWGARLFVNLLGSPFVYVGEWFVQLLNLSQT